MPKKIKFPSATHVAIAEASTLLRLYQIIGDPDRGCPALLPIGRTTWLTGVKEGRYPKPIKHGRSVFWKKSDITALLAKIADGQ